MTSTFQKWGIIYSVSTWLCGTPIIVNYNVADINNESDGIGIINLPIIILNNKE